MKPFSSIKPKTEIRILRQYLHTIALVQNPDDDTNWSYNTLADKISNECDYDDNIDSDTVRKTLIPRLKDNFDLDISRDSGFNKIVIDSDIDDETLFKLTQLYTAFVTTDSTQELILKKFISNHKRNCLWILAKIYFAKSEKKYITFSYTNNSNYSFETKVMPFHIVFRSNNLYLAGESANSGKLKLYVLNRITNIENTDSNFEGSIPEVSDIFKDSLSGFVGNKINVVLKFMPTVKNRLEEIISILEPKITDKGDFLEAEFSVSDDVYLCKQLLSFGNSVEILKPNSLRKKMVDTLKESLSVYE